MILAPEWIIEQMIQVAVASVVAKSTTPVSLDTHRRRVNVTSGSSGTTT
jgi:hypothetical protein